ncbi:signal peptidase I [Candidatus Saccharibacteria bacterium]|nr:MAG: signal peptidase I [Candidatus Saccharibacteria bacterium]
MDDNYTMYDTAYSTTSTTAADPAAAAAIMGFMAVYTLVVFAIAAIGIVSMWKLFEKAKKPGWAALVPVYNIVVLLEIIGRPLWWVAMMLVPIANLVFGVMMYIDLAKSFGKDAGYGVLLILFSPVMFPIFAFSKSTQYVGPVGPERHNTTPPATPPAPVTQ